jgi:bacteriocin biosynthesis cyclodehydratase domain-containing protein
MLVGMDIRLDPRLPLVWRDPQTLQIGVDRPRAVLDGVTTKQERIIAAIAAGHGRSGTPPIAQRVGCPDHEVAELVERLRPALVSPGPGEGPIVEVPGSSGLSASIAAMLTAEGVRVDRDLPHDDAGETPTLAIAVSSHVHDPVVTAGWLQRDVPHLCVVTGDSFARIGPVVVPGVTACCRCLDLHRADVDSAWGAIAGQLWGRPPREHSPLLVGEIAVRASRRALNRLTGSADRLPDAVLEMLDVDTGEVTTSVSRPHPDCGCGAPPRTGSVDAPASIGPGLSGSTRDSAVAELV